MVNCYDDDDDDDDEGQRLTGTRSRNWELGFRKWERVLRDGTVWDVRFGFFYFGSAPSK